jgi:prepilin-type N-terminal cleavage/methylation domain-containing protein
MKLIHCHSGNARASRDAERGFSMMEMIVVVAIIMVMLGITFISLQPALKEAHATNGYDGVLMQIRNARAKAVENRQQFIVCFGVATPSGATTPLGAPTAQSVSLFQWPAGTSLSAAIQVGKIDLPSDIQFQALTGLPAAAPDGFGSGAVAIDFDRGVTAAVPNQIMFLPDGSARDTAGNLNSGIIYIAGPDLSSTRAITVWGASGRIRGWRLTDTNPTSTAPWRQL